MSNKGGNNSSTEKLLEAWKEFLKTFQAGMASHNSCQGEENGSTHNSSQTTSDVNEAQVKREAPEECAPTDSDSDTESAEVPLHQPHHPATEVEDLSDVTDDVTDDSDSDSDSGSTDSGSTDSDSTDSDSDSKDDVTDDVTDDSGDDVSERSEDNNFPPPPPPGFGYLSHWVPSHHRWERYLHQLPITLEDYDASDDEKEDESHNTGENPCDVNEDSDYPPPPPGFAYSIHWVPDTHTWVRALHRRLPLSMEVHKDESHNSGEQPSDVIEGKEADPEAAAEAEIDEEGFQVPLPKRSRRICEESNSNSRVMDLFPPITIPRHHPHEAEHLTWAAAVRMTEPVLPHGTLGRIQPAEDAFRPPFRGCYFCNRCNCHHSYYDDIKEESDRRLSALSFAAQDQARRELNKDLTHFSH